MTRPYGPRIRVTQRRVDVRSFGDVGPRYVPAGWEVFVPAELTQTGNQDITLDYVARDDAIDVARFYEQHSPRYLKNRGTTYAALCAKARIEEGARAIAAAGSGRMSYRVDSETESILTAPGETRRVHVMYVPDQWAVPKEWAKPVDDQREWVAELPTYKETATDRIIPFEQQPRRRPKRHSPLKRWLRGNRR